MQIGSGADLYERPVDTFVARFLGESNLLEGTVGTVADGRATLAVAGFAQAARRPRRDGLCAGGAGLRAARAGSGPGAGRRFAGARRRDASISASSSAVRLALASGHELWSRRLASEWSGRDVVEIGWDASAISILPDASLAVLTGGSHAEERRMLLSLGAASLVTGHARPHRGPSPARAQGRPLTFCSWGGALCRAREDHDARSLRQAEEDRDRACVAHQLRQDQGDGRGRRAGMGPGGRRRPLHRPGQGHARDARHEPHPQREEPRTRAGSRAAASSRRPARRRSRGTRRPFPRTRGRRRGRISGTSKRFPVRAGSTSSSTTTTRRRCSPPACRSTRSTRSPTTR